MQPENMAESKREIKNEMNFIGGYQKVYIGEQSVYQ